MDFATWIRDLRTRAILTQDEIAAELGVSKRSVQDWEAGKAMPRPSTHRRIVRFAESISRGVAA